MTLWDLVRNEARDEGRGLFISASMAGVANAIGIALAGKAAASPGSGEKMGLFVMAVLCLVVYALCARRTYHRTTTLIERALEKIKLRVIDKIDRADVQGLERLGTAEIYDRVTENVTVISDSAGVIAHMLQCACLTACAALYILMLSPPAFAIVVLLNGAAMMSLGPRLVEIDAYLADASKKRVAFVDQLTDMLRGFKEIRLSQKRSRDVREDIGSTTKALRLLTVEVNKFFNGNMVLANCVIFSLILALVFVLPEYEDVSTATMSTLLSAVLFFWGPLAAVFGNMSTYTKSNIALSNIKALEEKLEQATGKLVAPENAVDPWGRRFSRIELQEISFAYDADADGYAFGIGPMNFSIAPGEVVFIVGGNGSGKSTFMKLLTGLYPASSGNIRLNGTTVRSENAAAYREMFSVIFSDFHLFSRLYGLLDANEAAVRSLLRQMKIDDKTSYVETRFTKRDLSTGQRKRLAMIVVLLEDRPIYVFDEWAADQDPEFRQYFYEELIPSLKRQGKTVIAVTHDDRYFDHADRVIALEYGKMKILRNAGHPDDGAPVSRGAPPPT